MFKKIKFPAVVTSVIILSLFISEILVSQPKDGRDVNFDSREAFFVDPVSFYDMNEKQYRLDVYIEVPLSNIAFKRNQSTTNFEADIDYTVQIKEPSNENVINESYSRQIVNTVNEHSNIANKSEFILRSFKITPGFYNLIVTVSDKNLYTTYTVEENIELIPVEQNNISFSDILLLSRYDESDPQRKIISPLVNNNVGNLNQFYTFFEIYNNNDESVLENFDFIILDSDGNEFVRTKSDFYLSPGVNQLVQMFSSRDLPIGNFNLKVVNSKTQQLFTTKDISFKWDYFPASIEDLDLAIRQTLYIASGDEYDKMRAAKTPEQKQRAFMEFWRSKDPNPSSPRNDKMVEYYERVRVANARYSTYFDGWRTDMGMIYIMYGDPSSIERNPFSESSKPYEIWEYYNISRRFVFVDNTGFGDYRLTTPIWDDRTRLRF